MTSNPLFNSDIENCLECAICLSPLVLPISLTCGHTYCEPCIKDKDFRCLKNLCPICRAFIPIDVNAFCVNKIIEKVVQQKYGLTKSYNERVYASRRSLYPLKKLNILFKVAKWLRQNLPWLIILALLYHLIKVNYNFYNFSMKYYKDKALQIANSIKGQDSLDFKFLLFSQFMKLLFSNISIP